MTESGLVIDAVLLAMGVGAFFVLDRQVRPSSDQADRPEETAQDRPAFDLVAANDVDTDSANPGRGKTMA